MMNVIIIDDDKKAADNLAERLKQIPDTHIAGIAYNGFDGLSLCYTCHPTVLFLDVELPDISGLDFLSRVEKAARNKCKIVMYTAYDKFVLPAIRRKAYDVLLKPIDDQEFEAIIKHLQEDDGNSKSEEKQTETAVKNEPDQMPAENRTIDFKSDGKFLLYTNSVDFRLVDIRDICLFKYNSELRCWEVIVSGCKDSIKLKRTVKSDHLLTLDKRLIQVHQKYIINMDFLIGVTDNICSFYPPFDRIEYVKVGRFYRKKLTDRFGCL